MEQLPSSSAYCDWWYPRPQIQILCFMTCLGWALMRMWLVKVIHCVLWDGTVSEKITGNSTTIISLWLGHSLSIYFQIYRSAAKFINKFWSGPQAWLNLAYCTCWKTTVFGEVHQAEVKFNELSNFITLQFRHQISVGWFEVLQISKSVFVAAF